MVHAVKICGEIYGIPARHLTEVLSNISKYEETGGINYVALKSAILEGCEEIPPNMGESFDNMHLDFDDMERRRANKPVSVGDYENFFGPFSFDTLCTT